jgi:hypothetical protein
MSPYILSSQVWVNSVAKYLQPQYQLRIDLDHSLHFAIRISVHIEMIKTMAGLEVKTEVSARKERRALWRQQSMVGVGPVSTIGLGVAASVGNTVGEVLDP